MIHACETLHHLWTGAARIPGPGEGRAFDAALAALCPVRRLVVRLDDPGARARVMPDDAEVMPMISLGDVAAEELDLELPYGTLLIFVPHAVLDDAAPPAARAGAVGRAYGQIVSETIHRGALPITREADIASALVAAGLRRAGRMPPGAAAAFAAFEAGLREAVRDVLPPGEGLPVPHPAGGDPLDLVEARIAPRRAAGPPTFECWLDAVQAALGGADEVRPLREGVRADPRGGASEG